MLVHNLASGRAQQAADLSLLKSIDSGLIMNMAHALLFSRLDLL